MLIDIDTIGDLKAIIATKRKLDAATAKRAKAQEEIDRCKSRLRELGVGVDGEMPATPTAGVRPNGGGIRKARKERKPRAPRAPRGIDPTVIEAVRTCLGDQSKSLPTIIDDTGLHLGVVKRALEHLGAQVTGNGRGTKYHLADGARVENGGDTDDDRDAMTDDEHAAGDVAEEPQSRL